MVNVNTISKRTYQSFSFHSEGDKLLNVYYNNEVYCQRWFILTAENLDARYEEWLEGHLADILELPEPEYASLKTYRKGMQSKRNWILSLEGKIFEEVFYIVGKNHNPPNPWIYHRKTFDHTTNPQTIAFCRKMPEIGAAWQELSNEEKNYWNNEARKLVQKRLTGFNLFTSFKE